MVLPGVPARSAMYREVQAFLKSRQSDEVPEHRRVNPAKARLQSKNLRGTVSVTVTAKDGDFDYAARKIIHIVHEIFMVFLVDGPYYRLHGGAPRARSRPILTSLIRALQNIIT